MKRSRVIASLTPLFVASSLTLAAGAPVACAQDSTPYTLHVYTNLIEVTALALNEDQKSAATVKRDQFAIRLDHGPFFHPTQMRLEGDDPISLAVLLDARGDQNDILKEFGKALPSLVPKYLHPADHVSIYAIDCALVGKGDQIPADATALKPVVTATLAASGLHGQQQHGACGDSIRLWDAVVQLTHVLDGQTGHRVLLVVSKGVDGKSASGFADTTRLAESKGVAIFGLRYWQREEEDPIQITTNGLTVHNNATGVRTVTGTSGADPDLFDQMCESTGGLAFNLWNPDLVNRLVPDVTPSIQNLMTMLRGRYILDFPRPDAYATGLHTIDVSVPGTHDFVATTGVTYSHPNPSVMADPTTVPSDPSPAQYGPRHPIR